MTRNSSLRGGQKSSSWRCARSPGMANSWYMGLTVEAPLGAIPRDKAGDEASRVENMRDAIEHRNRSAALPPRIPTLRDEIITTIRRATF